MTICMLGRAVCALLVAGFAAFPAFAEAKPHGLADVSASNAVRWVSPAGDDRSPGSRIRPWRTIGRALARAGPGTTVYLRAGSYVEETARKCGSAYNALNWRRSGTASAPITLSGAPGESTRVILRTMLNIHGEWLRLRDLVVDSNMSYSSFDRRCNGSVNVAVYGKHVALQRVTVRNAVMSGIYVNDAEDVSVGRSLIHDNGSHRNLDHGIYVSSVRGMLLGNNVIVDNLAYGIQFYKDETQSPRVIHNTVAQNGRSGLVLAGNVHGARVANNIFAWNRDYGIRDHDLGGENNLAVANLLFANKRGPSYLKSGRFNARDSLVADPVVAARHRRDYRLRKSSPARDRALAEYATAYDFAGKRRLGSADLGAYEFGR
jgi:Right handed beta helix region/Protein of unknown function (DUF1565)